MASFIKRLFSGRKKTDSVLQQSKESDLGATIEISVKYKERDKAYLNKLDYGLVLGEIVLLSWIGKNKINRKIPGYFKYVFGLDIGESVQRLVDLGFSTGGTSRAALTETSHKLLEKYYYIPDSKNCGEWMIRAMKYVEKSEKPPSYEEISSALLEEDLESYLNDFHNNCKNKKYHSARNPLTHISHLYKRKGMDLESLHYGLLLFIFGVSGWNNHNDYHENNVDDGSTVYFMMYIDKDVDVSVLEDAFNNAWSESSKIFKKHYLGKKKTFEYLLARLNNDNDSIRRLLNLDNRKKWDFNDYGQG